MDPNFVAGEKLLVLGGFFIMGFESVWIIYGIGMLINKALQGKSNMTFDA